jgi:hypothetical protein
MMAKGAKADGFTLHPYDLGDTIPGDTIPEHNWEVAVAQLPTVSRGLENTHQSSSLGYRIG